MQNIFLRAAARQHVLTTAPAVMGWGGRGTSAIELHMHEFSKEPSKIPFWSDWLEHPHSYMGCKFFLPHGGCHGPSNWYSSYSDKKTSKFFQVFIIYGAASVTISRTLSFLLSFPHNMPENLNKIYTNYRSTSLWLSTPMVQWLSYSPLDPRFVGSIPAEVEGFFQGVKILSMTSFRREKPWFPCHRFKACKRTSSQN